MATKGRRNDGRSTDLTFSWMLATLGSEWQPWQDLAAKWMAEQTASIDSKLKALSRFFEGYLLECASYAVDVTLFFEGYQGHHCCAEELETYIRKSVNEPSKVQMSVNYTCDFIDFVINTVFSEENDFGDLIPLVKNPLSKIKRQSSATETVRNPLPYRYIEDLRNIICPLPGHTELTVIKQS